jgi:hypothetical protein
MIAKWALSATDSGDPNSIASRLRAKRFVKFAQILEGAAQPVRILDVGGTPAFWAAHRAALRVDAHITLLNRVFANHGGLEDVRCVVGDARRLDMFADAQFDMCISNSVIEHLGVASDQRRMADEIRRVSRGYFVQTPNKYFPFEPHFLVPGWQFAPISVRAWLLQWRDWGWIKRAENPKMARETVESIRLLSARDLAALFPDALIYREKIGPFTKSVTAWRAIG